MSRKKYKIKLSLSLIYTSFFFLLSLFFFNQASAVGTNYYVDSSITDTNIASATPDCTTYNPTTFSCTGGTSSAFKTIADINAFSALTPGDSVLFLKGQTWRERLTVSSSGTSGNPITFGAYGSGNNPTIDGADVITGMTSAGSNIWQKTGVIIQPNLMYLNGIVGYPKTSPGAFTSQGDWYWDSGTKVFSVYSTSDPSGNIELGQREELVSIGSHQYITLSNLTIQHSNERSDPGHERWRGGVYMTEGSHLTMTGSIVQKSGFLGVRIVNSSFITLDNNSFLRNGETFKNIGNVYIEANIPGISDITFTNNQSNYSGGEGLFLLNYASKLNYVRNVDIHGNHFDNNNSTGLYISHLDSAVIYDNYFDGNGDSIDSSEDYAIGVTSCDNTDIYQNTITNQIYNDAIQVYGDATAQWGSSNNIRIFRNKISNTMSGTGIGIIEYEPMSINNVEISYNIISSGNRRGIVLFHQPSATTSVLNIFNNTLYENVLGGIYLHPNYPTVIKNNIFRNNGVPDMNATYSTTALTISNNLYYRASGNALSYNGNSYTTSTIKGFEPSAQNTDPLFVGSGDNPYSLQSGSPAINAGVDVGLTTDILGNTIVGTPDIGAYESNYTPPADIVAPLISSFTIPTTFTSLTISPITFTATDTVGVTGYLLSESSTPPSASSGSWSSTPQPSYTFTTQGPKTLYAFAKDAAGNVSLSSSASITITLSVITPPSSGGSSGGGGGGSSSPTIITCPTGQTLINNICIPTVGTTLTDKAKSKDIKHDGVINIFDFTVMMINWNKTYSTSISLSKGDITGDGKIDIFDINQLMVYWGVKY